MGIKTLLQRASFLWVPSSSVVTGEKLIDELEYKLEAPLVPNGHPNTNTDQDSDSNHILKDQEPETESAKSNGNGADPQSEDVEGMGSYLIPKNNGLYIRYF